MIQAAHRSNTAPAKAVNAETQHRSGTSRWRPHPSGCRCGSPGPAWTAGSGTTASVLELAVALKTEPPDRTAAQVAVVLAAHGAFTPSARTLQRLSLLR